MNDDYGDSLFLSYSKSLSMRPGPASLDNDPVITLILNFRLFNMFYRYINERNFRIQTNPKKNIIQRDINIDNILKFEEMRKKINDSKTLYITDFGSYTDPDLIILICHS